MVGSLRSLYMLLGKVLKPYFNNHCITICFGYALEAYCAAGDAKIPSVFPAYFGASNFFVMLHIKKIFKKLLKKIVAEERSSKNYQTFQEDFH